MQQCDRHIKSVQSDDINGHTSSVTCSNHCRPFVSGVIRRVHVILDPMEVLFCFSHRLEYAAFGTVGIMCREGEREFLQFGDAQVDLFRTIIKTPLLDCTVLKDNVVFVFAS